MLHAIFFKEFITNGEQQKGEIWLQDQTEIIMKVKQMFILQIEDSSSKRQCVLNAHYVPRTAGITNNITCILQS